MPTKHEITEDASFGGSPVVMKFDTSISRSEDGQSGVHKSPIFSMCFITTAQGIRLVTGGRDKYLCVGL
jgi:hypothetical protein